MHEVCEAVITATAPNGSTVLPFIIPREAEASAVQSFGCGPFVILTGACAFSSFDAHPLDRKIRDGNSFFAMDLGGEVEGTADPSASLPMNKNHGQVKSAG